MGLPLVAGPRHFRTISGQNLPIIAHVARFLSAKSPQGGYRTPLRRRSEGVEMRPRKIVRPKTVQHALNLANSDAEMYETRRAPDAFRQDRKIDDWIPPLKNDQNLKAGEEGAVLKQRFLRS